VCGGVRQMLRREFDDLRGVGGGLGDEIPSVL
jgi:hypothetical protein